MENYEKNQKKEFASKSFRFKVAKSKEVNSVNIINDKLNISLYKRFKDEEIESGLKNLFKDRIILLENVYEFDITKTLSWIDFIIFLRNIIRLFSDKINTIHYLINFISSDGYHQIEIIFYDEDKKIINELNYFE